MSDPISAIYEMLDKVVDDGGVPYMLVVPYRIIDDVQDEFPHMLVYEGEGGDISCVTADYSNYVNGEIVFH